MALNGNNQTQRTCKNQTLKELVPFQKWEQMQRHMADPSQLNRTPTRT